MQSIGNVNETSENMGNLADEFLGDIGQGLDERIDNLRRENNQI